MPRDQRWPLAWTIVLMGIHLLAAIILLGLAASDLSTLYNVTYTWSFWIVPQCCVVIIATIIHIVLVCTARLNPGWTLSFYLILWLAWVALATIAGLAYSFWDNGYGYGSGGYYWDGYEYVYDYNEYDSYSLLTVPKVMAEVALISICAATGLAIWIFCCVIVNRWRRERNILIQRGSQMPIQYVNVQTGQFIGQFPPGQFPPGQYPPGPAFDPQKGPYSSYYAVPPVAELNGPQYPPPTQPLTQNIGQYPTPSQTPVNVPHPYPPPPSQSPVQDKIQYPPPIQSPAPLRRPVAGSVQSDEYPTHYNPLNI